MNQPFPGPPIQSQHSSAGGEIKWPKIMGIISIVFSVLAIFGSVISFFTGAMLRFQMKTGGINADPAAVDAFVDKWNWYYLMGGATGLLMGILLLVGGISLLKLKKNSRPIYLIYSVLAILYGIFGCYMILGSGMIDEQMNVMFGEAEGSDDPAVKIGKMSGRIGGMVGGMVGLVFGMAPPIFFLIWFNRQKIKTDLLTKFR